MLMAPTGDQVETIILHKIRAILAERGGSPTATLSLTAKLNANLGLSSLDLALLVSELEFELGIDPFANLVAITSVRTIDDLVNAYRRAMYPEAKWEDPDDGFADAQRRAEKRRLRTDER
jgi:acyl carrier protein